MIEAIGQIHITVSDIARSVEFYRDALGLELLFEVPDQRMAFLDCGGVRLYLGQTENEDFRSRPIIYFTVPSVRDAFVQLGLRGVEFASEPRIVHRASDHDLWMAFTRDPDGNPIGIMSEEQRLSKAA